MKNEFDLPAGYTFKYEEDGFSLTAPLSCPMGEARSLAVICASWVRRAAGEGEIHWPNRVLLAGRDLCAIQCRGTAEGVRFTFRPDRAALPADGEAFARAVVRAAVSELPGYPENRPALLQAYCAHCVTVMKFVETVYRGAPLYGFAFAVDRHGGLMVMTQESKTVVTLYGGTVRLAQKENAPEPPALPRMPGN